MKPIVILFALALLLTGCAHTTERTGTIQLPPVEYVR